jgi:hypothetical protein
MMMGLKTVSKDNTRMLTWLNWKPMSASINALLPDVWWPMTSTAGASKGL